MADDDVRWSHGVRMESLMSIVAVFGIDIALCNVL